MTPNYCNHCTVMVEELELLQAKLELLAEYVETEDGVFSFPDGDYVETKKLAR